MLKIENLTKSYTTKKNHPLLVLSDISFEVAKGEIFGIIGKSGAGKSTLLKCLNLLERPDSGKVIIDGVDISKIPVKELRNARYQIGVIFQHFNLLSSKTVFDNIALPLIIQGNHSQVEIQHKVEEMLGLVGLSEFARKYPASLSGGQKQRVGIARALVTKPKLLLSDEATSALDPSTTSDILDLLLDINQKMGITIALITHEMEVIRKICDRVAIIDGGEIVESGKVPEIILNPKHPITRKLIIAEEADKYLEKMHYNEYFEHNPNKRIMLLSFIGSAAYKPFLNTIARESGGEFSILHGELGLIKKTPFGNLLIEFGGTRENLESACKIMQNFGVHYEIIR